MKLRHSPATVIARLDVVEHGVSQVYPASDTIPQRTFAGEVRWLSGLRNSSRSRDVPTGVFSFVRSDRPTLLEYQGVEPVRCASLMGR